MSADEEEQRRCLWCRLPRATKGITVGIVGSILVHAALLSAVAYSTGDIGTKSNAKIATPRSIFVGTFVIKARKPPLSATSNARTAKEI